MSKLLKRVLALFLVASMVFATSPTQAYATTNVGVASASASRAKRLSYGANYVSYRQGQGYTYFIAPSTGTYRVVLNRSNSAYKGKLNQTCYWDVAAYYKKSGALISRKYVYHNGSDRYGARTVIRMKMYKGDRFYLHFKGHKNYSGDLVRTTHYITVKKV